ncbi:hypothetical protein ACOI9D_07160 [Corynebacterium striatum]|uniref:hypothetical protein n=1 Tax=Corynebacterium striatum TaxID=43770 RepID=UPI003B5A32F8
MTNTDRTQPIAQIVPVSSPDSRVQQLVAAGILSHDPEPYSPLTTTDVEPDTTNYLPSKTDVVSLLGREDRV